MAGKTIELYSSQGKWGNPVTKAIQPIYDQYGPTLMMARGVEINLHDQAYRELGQPEYLDTEFGRVKVRTGKPTIVAHLGIK